MASEREPPLRLRRRPRRRRRLRAARDDEPHLRGGALDAEAPSAFQPAAHKVAYLGEEHEERRHAEDEAEGDEIHLEAGPEGGV